MDESPQGAFEAVMTEGEASPEAEPSDALFTDDAEIPAVEGVEAEAESEPKPPASDTSKHKVKVDGKEVEVTLKELRDGYQRQADYTRAKMDLAKDRRALAADVTKARGHEAEIRGWIASISDSNANPHTIVERLRRAGVPMDKILMRVVNDLADDEMVTPAERLQRERERFNMTKAEDEAQRRQRESQAEAARAQAAETARYKQWWPTVVADTGLPQTKFAHERVRHYLQPLWNAGQKPTIDDFRDAARAAVADIDSESTEARKRVKPEDFAATLSEEDARAFMLALSRRKAAAKAAAVPSAAHQQAARVPSKAKSTTVPRFRDLAEEMQWRNGAR